MKLTPIKRYRIKMLFEGGTEQDMVIQVPHHCQLVEEGTAKWVHTLIHADVAKEIWIDEIMHFGQFRPLITATKDDKPVSAKRIEFVRTLGYHETKKADENPRQRGWRTVTCATTTT